jgi:hypothetical protein
MTTGLARVPALYFSLITKKDSMNDTDSHLSKCSYCHEIHDNRVVCPEYASEQKKAASSTDYLKGVDLCPKAADGVHQYFETKKLYGGTVFRDEHGNTSATNQGVLIVCALCSNRKELW